MTDFNNIDPNNSFLTPKDFTDQIKKSTGLNLHELYAEALSTERTNMLMSGNSREYIKLLVPVFSKYAVAAPTKIENSNTLDDKSYEELQGIYDNLVTRAMLSQPSDSPVDSPKTDESSGL